jgi:putative ABC transport system permease protein
MQAIDPRLEITDYSTLEAGLGFSSLLTDWRLGESTRNAVVVPIYASLALLLASIGLYAVVARSVGRRTPEIGLRMALGASPGEMLRLILSNALGPVFAGLAIGLAASLAVNRMLQSQLVGVSPYDLLSLSVGSLLLIAAAVFGCILPARRAAVVDPAIALRHQ